MSNWDVEAVVIGGGVVGLAVGLELATRGLSTAVIERNPKLGQETSTRNSGIIHAGIYYPAGSIKARLCVEGRHLLYDFCARRKVPHAKVGKIVVAVNQDEEDYLDSLLERGRQNGAEGLKFITAEEAKKREPNLIATAAMLSPETGIISCDDFIRALELDLLDRNGLVLTGQEVVDLSEGGGGWKAKIRPARGEEYDFTARLVVNASGLWADKVARMAGVNSYTLHYARGDYYWTSRKAVNGLVYPVPEKNLAGLGVHTTIDLGGRTRFGPDVTYIPEIDYKMDESKAELFWRSISRYLKGLEASDLSPDTSGIRPKLAAEGEAVRDFELNLDRPGLLNLMGIESPGLTSSLALAREAAKILGLT